MVSPQSEQSALDTRAEASPLRIAPSDLIAGLGRGLAVIESFDDAHARMTATQVAERTGIPRSAARRHLLSLCHFGYADTDGKLFWLTPRVLRLGQSYLDGARLPRLVQPFIQRLSMQTGETVNVSVLDGHEVVYVARSNSPRVVSIGFHAGARVAAHVVSPGTVLLATLPDDALLRWAAAHEFVSFSANTPVQAPAFVEQVRLARQQDHWMSVGQLDTGLTGVATVLRDRFGTSKGALGMTVQSASWPTAQIRQRLVPALLETAQTLRSII